MSRDRERLRPAQLRRVDELWGRLWHTGSVEIPPRTGRLVLLLIGAVVFTLLICILLFTTAVAVGSGEEPWWVAFNPMTLIMFVGLFFFGFLGIPAVIIVMVNRPTLVLNRDGYAEVVGRGSSRKVRAFLPWDDVERIGATFIAAHKWPMPPTHLVTIVLTPEAFAAHTAGSGKLARILSAADRSISGPRSFVLRHGIHGHGRVLQELFTRAHEQFARTR
ncbi:hypothetical protein MTQ12_06260 [Brevibacterium sp. R8603A2]|uniref:PH domain-containing protein n=1 Tax=Brevibacterium pityocampae TaxID=506594 RepID=A0ABP8JI89_9MICO|nr:hypothetical protein [Brevibacterium sp. R8603A2]MCK1802656.1 hypothetical protein [Brevibacterium sp. R8603A2]